jgi:hypothetical protein
MRQQALHMDAFSAVKRFESSHRLVPSAMSTAYTATRKDLVHSFIQVSCLLTTICILVLQIKVLVCHSAQCLCGCTAAVGSVVCSSTAKPHNACAQLGLDLD